MILNPLSTNLLSLLSRIVLSNAIASQYLQSEVAGFIDLNIGYTYQVRAFNVTAMTSDAIYRSIVRVTRLE